MSATDASSPEPGTDSAAPIAAPRPRGLKAGIEIALLLGFFMLLGAFYTGGTGLLKSAGKVSVIIVLLLVVYTGVPYLVRQGALDRRLMPAVRWFAAFIAVPLVWMLVFGLSARGLTVTMQLALYLVFFVLLCTIRWTPLFTTVLSWPFALFFVASGLWWLASGLPMYFRGFMVNPNTMGAVAGFMLFFPLLALKTVRSPINRYVWWLIIGLGMALVVVSGARSIWIAMLGALAAYYAWPYVTRTRLRFSAAIWGMLAFAAVFTVVYALASLLVPVEYLNQVTGGVTGEGLFSGREILWLGLMQAILQSPVWGYGPGALASDFLPTDLSAHNSYLTVALQMGLLGILAYMGLLSRIWLLFWPGRNDPRVRLAAAFFIAILLHQVFELVFIQDKLAFNLSQWLIVGIGAGISLNWVGTGDACVPPTGNQDPNIPS